MNSQLKLTLIIPCSEKDLSKNPFGDIQSFYTKFPVQVEGLVISNKIPELPSATRNVSFQWIDSLETHKSKKILQGLRKATGDIIIYCSMDLGTPLAEHMNVIKCFMDQPSVPLILGTRKDVKRKPHGQISFKQKLIEDIANEKWISSWQSAGSTKDSITKPTYNTSTPESTVDLQKLDPSYSFWAIRKEWLAKILPDLQGESWFFGNELAIQTKKQNGTFAIMATNYHYSPDSQLPWLKELWKIINY